MPPPSWSCVPCPPATKPPLCSSAPLAKYGTPGRATLCSSIPLLSRSPQVSHRWAVEQLLVGRSSSSISSTPRDDFQKKSESMLENLRSFTAGDTSASLPPSSLTSTSLKSDLKVTVCQPAIPKQGGRGVISSPLCTSKVLVIRERLPLVPFPAARLLVWQLSASSSSRPRSWKSCAQTAAWLS